MPGTALRAQKRSGPLSGAAYYYRVERRSAYPKPGVSMTSGAGCGGGGGVGRGAGAGGGGGVGRGAGGGVGAGAGGAGASSTIAFHSQGSPFQTFFHLPQPHSSLHMTNRLSQQISQSSSALTMRTA